MNRKLMIPLVTAASIMAVNNSESKSSEKQSNYNNHDIKEKQEVNKNNSDKTNVNFHRLTDKVNVDKLLKSNMLIAMPG